MSRPHKYIRPLIWGGGYVENMVLGTEGLELQLWLTLPILGCYPVCSRCKRKNTPCVFLGYADEDSGPSLDEVDEDNPNNKNNNNNSPTNINKNNNLDNINNNNNYNSKNSKKRKDSLYDERRKRGPEKGMEWHFCKSIFVSHYLHSFDSSIDRFSIPIKYI